MVSEVIIAASDALPELKDLADFVCVGTHDELTWAEAIAWLKREG